MKSKIVTPRASIVFIILSLVGALANYLVYPFISRQFTTSQFGDFTLTMSIFNQVLSVLLAFNVISIALVKHNLEHEARFKAQSIQKALIWFFIILSLLILVFTPWLKAGLNIANPEYLFVLTTLLLVSVPSIIWSGYLQGHKKLVNVGMYLGSSGILKLFFAVVFASYAGITGGLLGVLIGISIATLLLWATRPIELPSLKYVYKKFDTEEKTFLIKVRRYVIGALFVVGSLGLLQNIDITLSKILFSPDVAGQYIGVSIISNAVYFLSFLIIWLMLPNISVGENSNNRAVLKKAYLALLIISIVTVGFELIFGELAISLLLGENFAAMSSLLVYATIFQLLLVAIAIYAYYLVVISDQRCVILSLAVVICSMMSGILFADSPKTLILSLIMGVLLGLTVYIFISKTFAKAGQHD